MHLLHDFVVVCLSLLAGLVELLNSYICIKTTYYELIEKDERS